VEQQARPTLRNRPLAVTNRLTKNACVVAASYEAKAQGVKVGMGYSEARLLCPGLIMVETDPPKYHYVYKKLVKIMRSYSPNIGMKSIDEGIIDFHDTRQVNQRPLVVIGQEIKQRLRDDVGKYMMCNIGIAPNRFLAKTAASLHKPDGLDIITHKNLRQTLAGLKLTDLTGIAERNQARLNAAGILTPLQFLDAPSDVLVRKVFHSVCGDDWYKRLRGWEVDDIEYSTKTVGRQFVMDDYNASDEKVRNRLAHLCESTGLKMRHKGFCARGISVYIQYKTGDAWHSRKAFKSSFYTTPEIFRRALLLFNQHPQHGRIVMLSVSCYLLEPSFSNQMSILEEVNKEAYLTEAVDEINDRYGNYTVTFANSLGADKQIKQKIPFGSTRYFELLCNRG
jgi:DNA polymerase-4